MWIANNWTDYECIDAANGEKLEKWADYMLIRPDPQVIWDKKSCMDLWKRASAHYHRSKSGGGSWEYLKKIPDSWQIKYNDLVFNVKPMGFKHTGIFPEQAINWDYMREKIRKRKNVKVLNLFAYTGGATVSCAKEGAAVTHVDASKGMVLWAKENSNSSGLSDAPIRYLVDDCMKFAEREIRRGNHYDAIIMDPPSYGRGPGGEVWKMEDSICAFVRTCAKLLSDEPLFFVINSYTTGLSPSVIENIMKICLPSGTIQSDEIGLCIKEADMVLPCGATARWER